MAILLKQVTAFRIKKESFRYFLPTPNSFHLKYKHLIMKQDLIGTLKSC